MFFLKIFPLGLEIGMYALNIYQLKVEGRLTHKNLEERGETNVKLNMDFTGSTIYKFGFIFSLSYTYL